MTALRPELSELPLRMRGLDVDDRGYPVPWFVAWVDGKPEFRVMDARKWWEAVRRKVCWVCGQHLGANLAFILGPMCAINRTISEPPSHRQCAEWSIRNCPFLSRPHMRRRENDMPEDAQDAAGIGIRRNPGVLLLWIAKDYDVFNDGHGKPLIRVGDPLEYEWWCEGRPATREEVEASVESGLPLLEAVARKEGPDALAELARRKQEATQFYPAAAVGIGA
ncbi:MAG TPA: hypothetical protein VH369_22285 [Bryobacteraceae bacterium]|jgi:hypothetical protein